MVKKYFLIILLIIILSGFALLYFYPVKEISGYISGWNSLYYCVNTNGTVDYYTNYYVQQLIDKGPEDCPRSETKSIVASKRLNIFEKMTINKYAKKIKENGNTGNHSVGSDGFTYVCVKIDEVKYYSDTYSTRSYTAGYEEYEEYELPDVIELSTYMWYRKPKECDQYWINSLNAYPRKDMDEDNYKGVLNYFRNFHNRIIEEKKQLESYQ